MRSALRHAQSTTGARGTSERVSIVRDVSNAEDRKPCVPLPKTRAADLIHNRIAMISLHTSPLDQPGCGSAGGMNVYVKELSKRLARSGIQVEIFTRAVRSALPAVLEVVPGVHLHHVYVGPGNARQNRPGQIRAFAREVLARKQGPFDVIHSHYWLSGQAGILIRDQSGVPLVHSMHTMARIKNQSLAIGDEPEPELRVCAEEQIVQQADVLVANTVLEARQLINFYDADPTRIEVVHPGVDLDVFRPVERMAARRKIGLPPDGHLVVFAGRIQPLKGPEILLQAAAVLLDRNPSLRGRLVVAMIGGPSGKGSGYMDTLARLSSTLGLDGVTRFVPPLVQSDLAYWYSAATVVCVPSHSESFGLVALEAQACGTPVVAAAVGGLATAVRDGISGMLIKGHNPADYARFFEEVIENPSLRSRMAEEAAMHAATFRWDRTTQRTLDVYRSARLRMSNSLAVETHRS